MPPLIHSPLSSCKANPMNIIARHKRLLTLLALLLVVSIVALRLNQYDPFEGAAVVDPPFTSLTYGIQTFLWWDEYAAALHLDWVRLMVFSHVKQIFAWKDLEPERGQFNFERSDEIVAEVESRGLKLVVRLTDAPYWTHPALPGVKDVDYVDAPPDDPADFGRYCGTLAARYQGRIAAYQVWNEPNLGREWGNYPPSAAGYVTLLAACAGAIRAADPQAIIISAGLAPTGGDGSERVIPDDVYFQQMYDAGFQRHADVAGVNAPGYDFPPEVSPDEAVAQGSQRFFTFRRVEDMRRIMVRNSDAARQMAILEMGWTTDPRPDSPYHWHAVTEAEQADYLVRAYRYAAEHWRPWMGLMSAIYIQDPAWGEDREEYWWSVTVGSGAIGQSFIALANMTKYCGERVIPAREPGSPEAMGLATVVPCP